MPKRSFNYYGMPVVRRTVKRRRVVSARRSRLTFGRNLGGRVRRSMIGRSDVHSFSRWVTSWADYNTTTGVNAGTDRWYFNGDGATRQCSMSFGFTLGDLPNVTEFSNLFDNYRINMIKFTIKLTNVPEAYYTSNATGISSANIYPTIWMVRDHDDSSTATVAQLKEFAGVKHQVLRPNKEISFIVRPSVLTQLYRTAVTTGYGLSYKQWLDMAQTDIRHYGVKFAIDFEGFAPPVGTAYSWTVNAKYYFQCKGTR